MPELAALPPQERQRAYRQAMFRSMRRPSFWVVRILAVVLIFGGILFGMRFFGSGINPGMPLWAVMSAVAVVAVGVIFWTMWWWHSEVFARELWRYMPQTCGHCGYDLRENVSGVCPECGRAFEAPAGQPSE